MQQVGTYNIFNCAEPKKPYLIKIAITVFIIYIKATVQHVIDVSCWCCLHFSGWAQMKWEEETLNQKRKKNKQTTF